MNNGVSVIIPVFNIGEELRVCLESLKNQSYSNYEIIIVDDGSERESAFFYEALKKEYERIEVIHCVHQGVSVARNVGVKSAKGKYIYFVDGDDYVENDALEKMVRLSEKFDADIVVTGYYLDVLEKESVHMLRQSIPFDWIPDEEELKKRMIRLWDAAMMYNVWNKLFLRSIIELNKIIFPEGKEFNEDRDFIRQYLLHIKNMVVTDECFYHYIRKNLQTVTGKWRQDMLEIRKEEYHILRHFFQKLGIYDKNAMEYVAREHFDRVVGTVEQIFHDSLLVKTDILQEIGRILNDEDTKECMKIVKPKSKKMYVILMVYKFGSKNLVYMMMKNIYQFRIKHSAVFYRLRQSR